MLDPTKDIQLIEQYLRAELSPDEKEAVQARLDTDADFKALLEEVALSNYVARSSAKEALAVSLKEQYWEQNSAKTRTFWNLRKPWVYAAAVVLLLIVIGIRSLLPPPSPDQLFAQYYELPSPPEVRGQESSEAWQAAVSAFQAKEWELAAQSIEASMADSSFRFHPRAYFFWGICLLELDQPYDAVFQFSEVDQESLFRDRASWYAALSMLKANDVNQAKRILEEISKQNFHYRHKEAKALLEKLER